MNTSRSPDATLTPTPASRTILKLRIDDPLDAFGERVSHRALADAQERVGGDGLLFVDDVMRTCVARRRRRGGRQGEGWSAEGSRGRRE